MMPLIPPRDVAARRIDNALLRVRLAGWTAYMRAEAEVRGISVGEGTVFYGRALMRRAPESTVVIGPRCRLRSAIWSNLAGLNRPCVLATLRANAELRLGSECGLSASVISAAQSIVLGDRVFCGANVTITDTDWHGLRPDRRRSRGAASPVTIEDDVWLGMGVTVLKGVTIGQGTVVSAGSVVVDSLPAFVIARGNPAMPVGAIPGPQPHLDAAPAIDP